MRQTTSAASARTRAALVLVAAAALVSSAPLSAQRGPEIQIAEPFKVGTFEIAGVPRVALVLHDALVVDIEQANQALERDPAYPRVPAPSDMLDLIGRYEYGVRLRLYEIVNDLVGRGRLTGSGRADFVHDLEDVRTLPPIMYPGKILNAAVNFYSHVNEAGGEEERREARRQRRENRGVPYLFLKPSRGAVIGGGDQIVIPFGRDRTDWEVELGVVIGRSAKYVSAENAQDHVFGYTVTIDVSDRGGRPPGGNPMTSDWFVGKGHDTFAPMGPWIIPKEFYGDPMERLRQTLDVGEERMQEATAGDMIHTLWELIEYGSSIATLYPGDVVNNGTSGGVGMGTAVRGETRFLQPGEVVSASIEGIGTLRLSVVAEMEPPGGTGARLPPVRSYRGNR
ncbi:fumarylacetoacetate hydrolase family protein [Candidatus Palauibacter sp.]|uniref:fumarylacetoacetate hydrolase family protein n=1 Tax=Candidatus Palauibacter sp. TaxID=3101350 RepID=UPI003AF28B7A